MERGPGRTVKRSGQFEGLLGLHREPSGVSRGPQAGESAGPNIARSQAWPGPTRGLPGAPP